MAPAVGSPTALVVVLAGVVVAAVTAIAIVIVAGVAVVAGVPFIGAIFSGVIRSRCTETEADMEVLFEKGG